MLSNELLNCSLKLCFVFAFASVTCLSAQEQDLALPANEAKVLAEITAMEKILPPGPVDILQIRSYNALTGEVSLAGGIADEKILTDTKDTLLKLSFVKSVDTSSVIPVRDATAITNPNVAFNEAIIGVKYRNTEDTLRATRQLIGQRYGRGQIWYLRAAAFLMAGKEAEAIGALRVAVQLDGNAAYQARSLRFFPLETFQGPLRLQYESMVDKGPIISSVTYWESMR